MSFFRDLFLKKCWSLCTTSRNTTISPVRHLFSSRASNTHFQTIIGISRQGQELHYHRHAAIFVVTFYQTLSLTIQSTQSGYKLCMQSISECACWAEISMRGTIMAPICLMQDKVTTREGKKTKSPK